jgi:hypothetical protein
VEQFFDPFDLLPGVTVSPGKYSYWRYLIQLQTVETRVLSLDLSVIPGEYLNGSRLDLSTEITWRPAAWFNMTGRYERNAIDLPEGDFTVHLGEFGLNFAPTPSVVFNLIGQYDNVSDELGVNGRLRWTVKPGSDVFLVYNQLRDAARGLATLEQDMSVKVVWDFRF